MPLVILQPCANQGAREHYNDTIKNTISLDDVSHLLTKDDCEILIGIYPDKNLKVWGVTPGKGGSNIKKWEKINAGDVTLLAASGKVFASAITTYKTHNPKLAEKLWGRDASDQTWEYIYFVSEVVNQDIPYLALNKVIPYADNYVIQGFNVLNSDQSENVLTAFDLASETFYPEVDAADLFKDLKDEVSLDARSKGTSRKEQGALRRILFKNKPYSNCCICGEEFPVSFLVAAHIKKRADCSLEEKKDFDNIVAPMCKMGCDELYEKGYIGVENKKVISLKKYPSTVVTNNYMNSIVGNICPYWHSESEPYYMWHVSKHRL